MQQWLLQSGPGGPCADRHKHCSTCGGRSMAARVFMYGTCYQIAMIEVVPMRLMVLGSNDRLS